MENSDMIRLWKEYVNPEKRIRNEDGFFAKALRRHGCRTVFDAALGGGIDSVQLIKAGFKVVSNEVDPEFREVAKEYAESEGVKLTMKGYDWRKMPTDIGRFDALICTGNSVTYLMSLEERVDAIGKFAQLIKPGGLAIIDQRNYDYILDNKAEILQNPKENFRYSGRYYYCSETIDSYPVVIEDETSRFEWDVPGEEKIITAPYYPIRRRELMELMESSGLKIEETYSDFKPGFNKEADFFQHIGIRK